MSAALKGSERRGCRRLLERLDVNELSSLLSTITNNLVEAHSREELIKAVISFTKSPYELLKRRKVSRDTLFSYLVSEGLAPSPKSDKSTLITQALQLWGADAPKRVIHEEIDQNSSHQASHEESTSTNNVSSGHAAVTGQNTDQFAAEFTKWYYQMLNSYHRTMSASQDFGPHHFFPESVLHMRCIQQHDIGEFTYIGAGNVSQRLLALITEEQVLFNPNLNADGLRVAMEPHGLCKIMVCGTVHSASDVVGLFEQQFGLVRDATRQDNWKIKVTHLQLKVGASQTLPTIHNSKWLPIES